MYNDDNEWVSYENDASLSKKVSKQMNKNEHMLLSYSLYRFYLL